MEKYLTDFEKDQLGEVMNIGAGNVSNAFSKMTGKRMNISVPRVLVERVETALRSIGSESEHLVTVVLVKLLGDIQGDLFLLFPAKSALKLAGLLTGDHTGDKKTLNNIDRSALQEVGNVLSGAGLTALSKFLEMRIVQSIPDMATDMLGSLVDTLFAEIGQSSDIVLALEIGFSVEEEHIEGQIFLLFNPNATAKILEATKKKLRNT